MSLAVATRCNIYSRVLLPTNGRQHDYSSDDVRMCPRFCSHHIVRNLTVVLRWPESSCTSYNEMALMPRRELPRRLVRTVMRFQLLPQTVAPCFFNFTAVAQWLITPANNRRK